MRRIEMRRLLLLLPIMSLALSAQTAVNGSGTRLGPIDNSGAIKTIPHRTGTGSPVGRDACSKIGETYFQSDAPAGHNQYGCTSPGAAGSADWAMQGAPANKYRVTFTEAMSVVVSGATHGLGPDIVTTCYWDSGDGKNGLLLPRSFTVDQTTYDVSILFRAPQSGWCVMK